MGRAYRLTRQAVNALVLGVTGVTAHPAPVHLVGLEGCIERLPKVYIGKRSTFAAPAARAPDGQPFGDPALEIFRISKQLNPARTVERLQGAHRRSELHAIVGRLRLRTAERFLVRAELEQSSPTSRTWVRVASAVGVDGYGGKRSVHRM